MVSRNRRQGVTFAAAALNQLLDLIARHGVLRENVPEILDRMVAGQSLEEITDGLAMEPVDLETAVEAVIGEHGAILDNPHCHEILMGELMGTLRGRVEGERVSRTLAMALARRQQ